MPVPVDDVVASFLAGELDARRWDHRAHLLVCHHLLAVEGGPAGALTRIRPLIQAHNARVGVRGMRGYHETITCYYVGAVHHVAATLTLDEHDEHDEQVERVEHEPDERVGDALPAAPALARTAPGRHWSPTALGSPDAAAGWVPPDRLPLPWSWPPA